MGLNDPFEHFKHKLWPKERLGVKLTIWFPTIKSQKLPQFPCVQVVCNIPFKSSQWGLQFCFRFHLHWRSAQKLWAFKVAKVPIVRISGWHFGVGPVAEHRVYYKEEDGGFPQVRAMVSLMSSWLPVVRPCTKMLQLCINQLVVWFVQVRVSKWIACQFF
jgi:hypothetical protein